MHFRISKSIFVAGYRVIRARTSDFFHRNLNFDVVENEIFIFRETKEVAHPFTISGPAKLGQIYNVNAFITHINTERK